MRMNFGKKRHMRHPFRRGDFGEDGMFGGGFGRRRGHKHGRGGRRGRPGRVSADELRLLFLHLLAQEPAHGYDLINRINALTNEAYAPSPGMVYPALSMMEDMGQIAASQDGARKVYSITAEGEAVLAKNAETLDDLTLRIARISGGDEGLDTEPVRQAMKNLGAALRDRYNKSDVKEDVIHGVADLLDEVARKIKKL